MKRKRGRKKGKPNKKPAVAVVKETETVPVSGSPSTEDNSDPNEPDNAESNSPTEEVDTPSTMEAQPVEKVVVAINPVRTVEKKPVHSVYGRVKVKLKTSKAIEPQPASSDVPSQSDAEKTSQQMGKEKQDGVALKTVDSSNTSPEVKTNDFGSPSVRTGTIKIKSSKGLGPAPVDQGNDVIMVEDENTSDSKPITVNQDHTYNKQELDAALDVIKRVMKMEAAEPFNIPVDPMALGIPDYFEVIDTPMDFGTICSNLENGMKYLNSADVFNDVKYIWENCYMYNSKGTFIVELMKRVKKNFTKSWLAAGLYNDELPRTSDPESLHVEDSGPSSEAKFQMKGGKMKNKLGKQGFRRHKDGCLCAICNLKRKKIEREARERAQNTLLTGTSDSSVALESRQEGTSPIESPYDEEISSNLDLQDQDSDVDMGGKGQQDGSENFRQVPVHQPEGFEKEEREKAKMMHAEMNDDCRILELSPSMDGSREKLLNGYQTPSVTGVASEMQFLSREDDGFMPHEEETPAVQQKHQESHDKEWKPKMPENFVENPMLLELAATLFPRNSRTIWSGPHSLVRHQGSSRSSSIHAAIETFMK